MDSCVLHIKSSSGGQYNAAIYWDASGVTAMTCDCNAGMFGDFCKHLRTLFEADESLLMDETQSELFRELSTLALNSMPGSQYAKLQRELKHIDVEKKQLSKRAAALKQEFMTHLKPKA